MIAPRVTKIVCPSCEGSGFFLLGMACLWCGGVKRLPVVDARRFADVVWTFAGGGYIAGDYSYEDKLQQEAKAERIYELTGAKAPWLSQEAAQ